MYYLAALLLLAALPVVIILFIVYQKDKNKEPMALLIKLFLSGFLACGLTLFISRILRLFLPFMDGPVASKSFVGVLLYAFIGVALVEEFSKWIMTFVSAYQAKEFDELYDGIVYAIFVSLGFAFLENILYVLNSSSINTALSRAISAVPSHACDAVFMGYYLSMAKNYALRGDHEKERKNIAFSILVPAILHGTYDFCLMSGLKILSYVFIVFVIFLYGTSIQKLKAMSKGNKKIKFENKFCKVCGKLVTSEICPKCGTKQG